MNINNRLKKIADFVENNKSIIDIGCDHAFLCIYLVKTKENIKAIASDINSGPLTIAKKNIEDNGLSNIIKTKLGNGLEPIEDDTNIAIISGMGGETISKIIEEGKEKLKNINKIIVSPNSDFYLVRKTITEIGYKITGEVMIKYNKKIYPIIVLEKGRVEYSINELIYGPILIKEKSKEFIEYYTFMKKNLLSFIDKITEDKKEKVKEEIECINNILK